MLVLGDYCCQHQIAQMMADWEMQGAQELCHTPSLSPNLCEAPGESESCWDSVKQTERVGSSSASPGPPQPVRDGEGRQAVLCICGGGRDKLHNYIFGTMSPVVTRSKARPQMEVEIMSVPVKSGSLANFKITIILIHTFSLNGAVFSESSDSMTKECLQSPDRGRLGTWNEAVLVGPSTKGGGISCQEETA